MTMLETSRSTLLRQRFGVIAERACNEQEDDHTTTPRKKCGGTESKPRRDSDAALLSFWWFMGWQMPHLRM